MKKYSESSNENIILELLLEIFKAHKKCQKYMTQKEALFSSLMIDTYKAYIKNKIKLPENASVFDMAIKLCQYEINSRKLSEKQGGNNTSGGGMSMLSILPDPVPRANSPQIKATTALLQNEVPTQNLIPKSKSPPNIENIPSPTPTPPISLVSSTPPPPSITTMAVIPSTSSPSSTTSRTSGISKARRSGGSKGMSTESKESMLAQLQMVNMLSDPSAMSSILAMYGNPTLMSMLSQYSDKAIQNQMMSEYYKQLGMSSSGMLGLPNLASLMPGLPMNLHSSLHSPTPSSVVSTSPKIQDSINVSSELTITAVTDNKSSSQKSSSSTSKSSQLPSVLKKDLPSSSFSSKLFQDTPSSSLSSWNTTSAHPSQTKKILTDLPKSLSITPTSIPATQYRDSSKQQKSSQPKVRDSQKFVDKMKPNKKSLINPYALSGNSSKQSSKQSSKLPTQSPLPGFTLQEYNQQLALLSKYTSQLNSAGFNIAALPTKKTSTSKKQQQHSPQLKQHQQQQQQLMQQTSIIPIPSISPQSQSSRTPPIVGPPSTSTYNKNMSPIMIKSSPTKSPILPMNYSRQSMTPPSTSSLTPTKTLQQKLAEAKQKANACMVVSEANNAKKSGWLLFFF